MRQYWQQEVSGNPKACQKAWHDIILESRACSNAEGMKAGREFSDALPG
jgi:hypothetical protein